MMIKVLVSCSRATAQQPRGWGEAPRGVRLPLLGMVLLSAWAGVAGAALAPPPALSPAAPGAFNFAYQSEGARIAAPTQVFDDGHRTYMQFNALDRVPELWTDEGGGRAGARRITFHLESPYVVVDQVLPRMRLIIDGEDTLLINQAWKGHGGAHPAGAKALAPRIWTDRTVFGPDDPPGPVASSRAVRPSHDSLPRGAGAMPPGHAAAARPSLAVSEDDDAEPETSASSAAPLDPEQANQQLAEQAILTTTLFDDSQLEAMHVQALELIARAHETGDQALERRLRAMFQDLASIPLADAKPRRRPGQGSSHAGQMLALAETRPRSDVPVRDEVDPVEAGALRARRASQLAALREDGNAGAATPAAAAAQPRSAVAGGSSADANPAGSALAVPPGPAAAGDALRRDDALVFEVRDNQRLSQALGHFLETLGWRLEWESQSDFVVRRGYVVKAPTLRQVLLQTLGEDRLSAVLYSGNLVVAVTGGDR